MLHIAGKRVTVEERRIPLYGQPYHVQITPDGMLGLVAGTGNLNGPDADLISLVDLSVNPIHTIDHVTVGTGPESFDISPDGRLVAVVLMEGSNVPADDPQRLEYAPLRLFKRKGSGSRACRNCASVAFPKERASRPMASTWWCKSTRPGNWRFTPSRAMPWKTPASASPRPVFPRHYAAQNRGSE